MKKVTAWTKYEDGGFIEIAYNYKEVSEDGKIIKDNAKGGIIVMDEKIKKHIQAIEKFLMSKIEE